MKKSNLELKDIANELLIINRYTVENIFKLDNCADCIALYMFYYKTAKWQKTNCIKATDNYVCKTLGWGSKKLKNTKDILRKNGLIDIVQRRTKGKIDGWYIQVSYLVSQETIEEPKTLIIEGLEENTDNNSEPDHSKDSCGSQKTDAYIINNICLKNKDNNSSFSNEDNTNSLLKANEKEKNDLKEKEKEELEKHFEIIWKIYPHKKGKTKAFTYFLQWIKGRKINNITIKLTDMQMYRAVKRYADECKEKETEEKFIKHGDTFFNTAILDYIDEENSNE